MRYDAFISYSHRADGGLALGLRRALRRFTRPWYRPRAALHVFLDRTELSAGSGLRTSLCRAMDDSRWFVLLASPDAARSDYVNDEARYWVSMRGHENILLVHTRGTLHWDRELTSFSPSRSNALPEPLFTVFPEEPIWVDLTGAGGERGGLTLRNPRFRDAVATLAAPIHGLPKEKLDSDDRKQHRLAAVSAVLAAALLIASVTFGGLAAVYGVEAAEQADRSAARRLVADSSTLRDGDPERSRLFAVAAAKLAPDLPEVRAALAHAAVAPILTVWRDQPYSGSQAAVAVSLDGRTIAVGADGQVRLFDGQTRARLGEITIQDRSHVGGLDDFFKLAFASDGRTLTVAVQGEPVQAWDVRTRTQKYSQALDLTGAAFDPTGTIMATLSNGTVTLRKAVTGEQLGTPFRVENVDGPMALNRNGRWIAIADQSGKVRVWDTARGERVGSTPQMAGEVTQLVFSPDGTTLAVGGSGTLQLWDVRTSRPDPTLIEPSDGISAMAFSPDGTLLATSGQGGTMMWETLKPVALGGPLPDHGDNVAGLAFRPGDGALVTAGVEGVIRVRSANDRIRRRLVPLTDHYAFVTPDGNAVIGRSEGRDDERVIQVWDTATDGPPIPLLGTAGSEIAALSADGRLLAAILPDGRGVQLWDVPSRRPLGSPILAGTGRPRIPASFSPDGKLLAVGADDGVRVWDVEGRRQVRLLNGAGKALLPVRFSPAGDVLVTRDDNYQASLWHVRETWSQGLPLLGTDGTALVAAFTPDGRTLATSPFRGQVRLWDVTTRKLLDTLDLPGIWSSGLEFNHAGDILAVGTWQAQTLLVHLASREVITSLPAPKAWITSNIRFSPDDTQLALTTWDKTARFWDVSALSGDLAGRVCMLAGRSLTEREWHEHVPSRPYQPVC